MTYLIRYWSEGCLTGQEIVRETSLPVGCTGEYVNQYLGFTGVEVQVAAEGTRIVAEAGYAQGKVV